MRGDLRERLEGKTRLLVPEESLSSPAPPTYPVFFNPAAKLNRDISVSVARAMRPSTFLDALAGTGARGIRVANESTKAVSVTLVDFNEASLAVARRNVEVNGLGRRCTVVHEETNRFLYSRFEREEKFEAVDIDPFGSPAPYLQGASLACSDGATLSFTATDAAVLCAVYPAVTLRRYGAASVRNEFVHETALRILVGFAVRSAAVNDIGVEPVAVHSTRHYLRAFVRTRRGAARADDSVRNLGYVTQCNGCGSRLCSSTQLPRCEECATRLHSAGPIWTGRMADPAVVGPSVRSARRLGMDEAARTLSSLEGLDGFPPYAYSLERACSRLRAPSVSLAAVREALETVGFASVSSPFDELSVKTTAGYRDFLAAVGVASGSFV